MKKISSILVMLLLLGAIFTVMPAKADDGVVQTIINTIKTRGQTSTTTPKASTAVRG